MDSYPLLGKIKERHWQRQLRENETVKNLFDMLVRQSISRDIPFSSITGHESVITSVAKFGDINQRFGKGETLLHWAVSNQQAYALPSSKVLVLLLLGADPNIQDLLGRTPLHWAVNHDCSDIAEDKDMQYERQCRPEAMKILRQLLSFNASPNIVDTYGASPLCHAMWSKCFDIVDILQPLTDEYLPSDPEFTLENTESAKSIRCSNVGQWIKEHTSDASVNNERLYSLMFSPGTGFLQHEEEVELQMEQVLAFFRKMSSNIKKEDPLLEFVPRLAGSMAEGTKCQKPDEQDIILRLIKFESACVPEESEFAPNGMITLKFTGNYIEMMEYEKYILDGYLNREEILYSLMTKLEKEVSSTATWSGGDVMNLYPSHDLTVELRQAIEVGDIGNLSFIWHGKYYKQIKLSIDIVPAIIIKSWRPDAVTTKDPMGRDVPKETFLILRSFAEDFEYDLEMYGELDCNTGTLGNGMSSLDTLNGDNWDSGSDCVSEKGDDVNYKDDYYNTSAVREFRNDFGLSVPKSKMILRNVHAIMDEFKNYSGTESSTKQFKTVAENDENLHLASGEYSITESFRNESGISAGTSSSKTKILMEIGNPESTDLDEPIRYQSSDTDAIECVSVVDESMANGTNSRENTNTFSIDKENPSEVSKSSNGSPEHKDSASLCLERIAESTYRATYSAMNKQDDSYNIDTNAITFEIQFDRASASSINEGVIEHSTFRFGTNTENDTDGILYESVLPPKENRNNLKRETTDTTYDNLHFKVNLETSSKLEENTEQVFNAENNETCSKTVIEGSGDDAATLVYIVDDDSDEDYKEKDSDTEEDSSEEPREDMGFRISYSKWEADTMASFPYCIKSAYILSKILVSYVPEIRAPLNRGIYRNQTGYLGKKDMFSYLLKMALFSVIKKNQNHDFLKTVSNIRSGNEDSGAICCKVTRSSEQVIYSRTGECKTSIYPMHAKDLKQITFWVNEIFSEIEFSAENGCLYSYFDPTLNILERISNAGKQKSNPYPSLLYLRKHCQMMRALVRIEEDKQTLC